VAAADEATWVERAENVALGLSVLAWGIAGEVQAGDVERRSIVRLTVSLLNVCVGLLLITRAPAVRRGSALALAASLPSMIAGGLALRLAPAPAAWSRAPEVLFAFGGAFAVFALASLGRSFAVLPAFRAVVARGPYGWIRHPAYAGELLMIAACAIARGDALGATVFAVAVALGVARIVVEERLLGEAETYRAYSGRVRFRLVPGVW
jgi:protein-S-isoprenylcysteine O-methyltransferase Ste14